MAADVVSDDMGGVWCGGRHIGRDVLVRLVGWHIGGVGWGGMAVRIIRHYIQHSTALITHTHTRDLPAACGTNSSTIAARLPKKAEAPDAAAAEKESGGGPCLVREGSLFLLQGKGGGGLCLVC